MTRGAKKTQVGSRDQPRHLGWSLHGGQFHHGGWACHAHPPSPSAHSRGRERGLISRSRLGRGLLAVFAQAIHCTRTNTLSLLQLPFCKPSLRFLGTAHLQPKAHRASMARTGTEGRRRCQESRALEKTFPTPTPTLTLTLNRRPRAHRSNRWRDQGPFPCGPGPPSSTRGLLRGGRRRALAPLFSHAAARRVGFI